MNQERALKDERVQLVETRAWIDAVDDWRFANRIPSRAAAIRQLVEIGLQNSAASTAGETTAGNAFAGSTLPSSELNAADQGGTQNTQG